MNPRRDILLSAILFKAALWSIGALFLPSFLRAQQGSAGEPIDLELDDVSGEKVLVVEFQRSAEDLEDYHFFIDTSSDLEDWKSRYYEDAAFSAQSTEVGNGERLVRVQLSDAVAPDDAQFARYRAVPKSRQSANLVVPGAGFSNDSHTVSTTFFHWFASGGGQRTGPWIPVEKRVNWTGLPPWWKSMVKQVMMANIDIIYVHLINSTEERRDTLFQGLNELRLEGYDIPKIAPFLDPLIIWGDRRPADAVKLDLALPAVKDLVAAEYIRFYNQYFLRNTDARAAEYLATIDGRPVIASWHAHLSFSNLSSLQREDLRSRFETALGAKSAIFTQPPYMVTTALNNPAFAFADERVPLFEINQYYRENVFNNLTTVQLKPGYWDQNIRNPGDFLPRAGGVHFKTAWGQVHDGIDRVYVESFNEYDEGTGIYAGSVESDSPYIAPGSGNTNTDTWSTTNDPYEYLRTTAAGAALFNDRPELDSLVLNHTLPTSLAPSQVVSATVTLRNEGDASWTGAAGFAFGQLATDEAKFHAAPIAIVDTTNEIPLYSGIFRGRPIVFTLSLTAPVAPGYYETNWQMTKNGVPFGETLTFPIEVALAP